MGGICAGVFSPTEGASVGAFGALVIGVLLRRVTRRVFVESLREAVELTVRSKVIIGGVSVFEEFISSAHLPQGVSAFINRLDAPNAVVIGVIVRCLIPLGGVMEVMAIIFITSPVPVRVIVDMGCDPIWWGIITITGVEFGMFTRPVGRDVFVVAKMVKQATIAHVFHGVLPFLTGDVVRLALLLGSLSTSLLLAHILFQ